MNYLTQSLVCQFVARDLLRAMIFWIFVFVRPKNALGFRLFGTCYRKQIFVCVLR